MGKGSDAPGATSGLLQRDAGNQAMTTLLRQVLQRDDAPPVPKAEGERYQAVGSGYYQVSACVAAAIPSQARRRAPFLLSTSAADRWTLSSSLWTSPKRF